MFLKALRRAIFIVGLLMLVGCSGDEVSVLNRPAEFKVLSEVRSIDPGPYSFTVEEGPVNSWIPGGSFEPISFRTKVHAIGSSPNEIILPKEEIDGWDVLKSGFYRGAKVRVYRVVNGRLEKIREDRIKEHHASGWNFALEAVGENKLIAPDSTNATLTLPSWSRRNCFYYFCVFTVDTKGRISPPSQAAPLYIDASYPAVVEQPDNSLINFNMDGNPVRLDSLSSPSGLNVQLDQNSGFITLRWSADDKRDYSGYLIGISDYPPEKHQGYHLFLEQSPADPRLHIQKGDMIFIDQKKKKWEKEKLYSNRVFNTQTAAPPSPLFDYSLHSRWSLVDHPKPLPEDVTDHGSSCLLLEADNDNEVRIGVYNHSGTVQRWYKVLDPEKQYVVEFLGRQEGLAKSSSVIFGFEGPYEGEIKSIRFDLTSDWKRYRAHFKVPKLLQEDRPGRMILSFTGPGKVWLDNWRVYESQTAFMDFSENDYQALKESGMAYFRAHSNVRTRWGYSMKSFTDSIGNSEFWGNSGLSSHGLPSLLRIIKKGKLDPWLQIEMCMDEKEWLGFVEYFCAPYSPDEDSPEKKPWAYKRYQQGQKEPWIKEFDRILFEMSNETWNGLFKPWFFYGISMPDVSAKKQYVSGEIYGLFQEYVVGILKSSPYWSLEVDEKFQFILGGWALQTGDDGYGQQAMKMSPTSDYLTIAAYNGGWDERRPPAKPGPKGFSDSLTWAARESVLRATALQSGRSSAKGDYYLGTYEGGPGYNLDGLNGVSMTQEQVEQEAQTMKSLAAGTATLDVFLAQSYHGFKVQNFFTFSRNRYYWSSHAKERNGGQPYPAWKALSLYNRYGTGDFLEVETRSAPTWDFPQSQNHRESKKVPLVAAYATRKQDRLNLFVLSRKVIDYPLHGDDGFSPVTVHLPFSKARKVTLFKMSGDPAAHNLDGDHVQIERIDLHPELIGNRLHINEKTGADARGLPPASTFLYVFEGLQ